MPVEAGVGFKRIVPFQGPMSRWPPEVKQRTPTLQVEQVISSLIGAQVPAGDTRLRFNRVAGSYIVSASICLSPDRIVPCPTTYRLTHEDVKVKPIYAC